ncbi:lactonase family protein [Silvibacterium acidisoli]|uniref:lactonase family protein n=1 Tax=Acidobacteriaceae bacterium ZG23-2 TaxID=2883246 RepID=UPI00406C9E8F
MKFKNSGRMLLALVVSLGLGFCITSCSTNFTAGYIYVTGSQYNQIGAFNIRNNTGNLTAVPGQPFGSGGTDPIRSLVASTGRFLYVLNAGAESTTDNADGSQTASYSGSNIAVFSIGGYGNLAPQQTYATAGTGPIRIQFSSTGAFLYVLEKYMPVSGSTETGVHMSGPTTDYPCKDASDPTLWHPRGDIAAYSVDTTTGRLSLLTNNQQTPLTVFPVGCDPIDMKVTSAYALVAENGPEPTINETSGLAPGAEQTVFEYAINSTSGQLTTTQNTELSTGAIQISTITTDVASKYLYVADTAKNEIRYFTIGTGGLLQAVNGSPAPNDSTASNPVAMISDSKSQFLYVANAGPNSGISNPASEITAFTIAANGVLNPVAGQPFPTDSGPQCILEDPTNQYIYTANFNAGTVRGSSLDPNSGNLTDLRNNSSYATVGNPTWCTVSSHVN